MRKRVRKIQKTPKRGKLTVKQCRDAVKAVKIKPLKCRNAIENAVKEPIIYDPVTVNVRDILVSYPEEMVGNTQGYTTLEVQYEGYPRELAIHAANVGPDSCWTEKGLKKSRAHVMFGENGECTLTLQGKKIKLDVLDFELIQLLSDLYDLNSKFTRTIDVYKIEPITRNI